MADAWLPGAGRLPSRHHGGPLQGGAPRAVWHTTETDPLRVSARSAAERLEQRGTNAHIIWNPVTGDTVQMVPATQPALLLPHGVGREGRRCLQILVVGFAREPFTSRATPGIEAIVAWLDAWQVPRRWPAGDPLPPPDAYTAGQDRRLWARGGHFGVSQVPHGRGPGPGAIDTGRITGHGRPRQLPLGEAGLTGIRATSILPGAAVPAPGTVTPGQVSGTVSGRISPPVAVPVPVPVPATMPAPAPAPVPIVPDPAAPEPAASEPVSRHEPAPVRASSPS